MLVNTGDYGKLTYSAMSRSRAAGMTYLTTPASAPLIRTHLWWRLRQIRRRTAKCSMYSCGRCFCRTLLHHPLHWLVYKSGSENGLIWRSTARGRRKNVRSKHNLSTASDVFEVIFSSSNSDCNYWSLSFRPTASITVWQIKTVVDCTVKQQATIK